MDTSAPSSSGVAGGPSGESPQKANKRSVLFRGRRGLYSAMLLVLLLAGAALGSGIGHDRMPEPLRQALEWSATNGLSEQPALQWRPVAFWSGTGVLIALILSGALWSPRRGVPLALCAAIGAVVACYFDEALRERLLADWQTPLTWAGALSANRAAWLAGIGTGIVAFGILDFAIPTPAATEDKSTAQEVDALLRSYSCSPAPLADEWVAELLELGPHVVQPLLRTIQQESRDGKARGPAMRLLLGVYRRRIDLLDVAALRVLDEASVLTDARRATMSASYIVYDAFAGYGRDIDRLVEVARSLCQQPPGPADRPAFDIIVRLTQFESQCVDKWGYERVRRTAVQAAAAFAAARPELFEETLICLEAALSDREKEVRREALTALRRLLLDLDELRPQSWDRSPYSKWDSIEARVLKLPEQSRERATRLIRDCVLSPDELLRVDRQAAIARFVKELSSPLLDESTPIEDWEDAGARSRWLRLLTDLDHDAAIPLLLTHCEYRSVFEDREDGWPGAGDDPIGLYAAKLLIRTCDAAPGRWDRVRLLVQSRSKAKARLHEVLSREALQERGLLP